MTYIICGKIILCNHFIFAEITEQSTCHFDIWLTVVQNLICVKCQYQTQDRG